MRDPRRLALVATLALGASASTRGLADAEEPAKPADGAHRCSVTGRVVDGWGDGVPGARVAWVGDAPGGDRSVAAAVPTSDDGRFRLELDGPAGAEVRGTIHATRGEDAAGLLPIVVGAGDRAKDAGVLALGPARPLHVDVRRDGAPVSHAQAWLWAGAFFASGRSLLFVGTADTDPTGRAEFGALPAAVMKFHVGAPDGSVGETTLHVVPGSKPSRASVELLPSRVVDVLVTTADSPPRPVAGAAVRRKYAVGLGCMGTSFYAQAPHRSALTGDDGLTRVHGLPADRSVELEARIEGRPRGTVRCEAGQTSATIVLPQPTRFAVEDGERPRPPDGTKLVVHGWRTGPAGVAVSMEDGSIAVPLADYEIRPAYAVAPDGALAPLEKREPTSFFRPRSLVVRLVEEDGRGVAGARVSLASSSGPGPWQTPIPADEDGRVRFEGLAPVEHFVQMHLTAQDPGGHRIADVDLASGDAAREIVLRPEVTLLVRVTVDGEPAIPEWFRWTIPDVVVLESDVDRAGGSLRVRARAESGASLTGSIELEGKGVRSRVVSFPWPARGATTRVDVALSKLPEVILDVRADPGSDVYVHLDEWGWSESREGDWRPGEFLVPHEADRTSVELPEGRYRLRDATTRIVSEVFEVPDRGAKVVAALDLRSLVTVRGRIEVPAGADAREVELVVLGDGMDTVTRSIPGNSVHQHGFPYDGKSFVVRVPAGRRFTFSPWHPTLQPAREGGVVSLVGPQDDVVLEMGPGATLVATLVDPSGRPLSADELRSTWVSATPAAHPEREPVRRAANPVPGRPGTVSASGLPFGTLDVWIGAGRVSARRVGPTTVADDVTDLGEVRLTRGARVLLRGVAKAGAAPPVERVKGYAYRMGLRGFDVLESSAEGAGVLGEFNRLGEGRWRIEVEWFAQTPDGMVREERVLEVDVDGEREQTLEVSLDERPPPARR